MANQTSSPKRTPLNERSTVTFSEIVARPDDLYSAADFASAGLWNSYSSFYRAVRSGKVPEFKRLPSGQLAQAGRAVLDALDLWPAEDGSVAA